MLMGNREGKEEMGWLQVSRAVWDDRFSAFKDKYSHDLAVHR